VPFPLVLCRLPGASAGFVLAVFYRCVYGCTPIFLKGVAVYPEELDKLFRPHLCSTGSFVSPVRNQLSMPFTIIQRMSAAVLVSVRCPWRWIRNR
jgi:hypothetical protein